MKEAQELSPGERAEVERFGLDKPPMPGREDLAKAIHEAEWPATMLDLLQGRPKKSWARVKSGETMGDVQSVTEAYARADAVLVLLAGHIEGGRTR